MILLVNATATLFLVGLIWFVQLVHYPLFSLSSPDTFGAFHREHTKRTTWVVVVPMVVELATSIWLVVQPQGLSRFEAIVGAVLVSAIWLSTAALQVPQHTLLSRGFDHAVAAALVRGNWIRTVLWTARAVLCLVGLSRLVAV